MSNLQWKSQHVLARLMVKHLQLEWNKCTDAWSDASDLEGAVLLSSSASPPFLELHYGGLESSTHHIRKLILMPLRDTKYR